VSFSFYKLLPEFRRLAVEKQQELLNGLVELVEEHGKTAGTSEQKMILLTYSCVGTRPDVDVMFWKIAFDLDAIQAF
jgi:chlorite dismutase